MTLPKCSFCGVSEDEAILLLKGQTDAHICESCIVQSMVIITKELKDVKELAKKLNESHTYLRKQLISMK